MATGRGDDDHAGHCCFRKNLPLSDREGGRSCLSPATILGSGSRFPLVILAQGRACPDAGSISRRSGSLGGAVVVSGEALRGPRDPSVLRMTLGERLQSSNILALTERILHAGRKDRVVGRNDGMVCRWTCRQYGVEQECAECDGFQPANLLPAMRRRD